MGKKNKKKRVTRFSWFFNAPHAHTQIVCNCETHVKLASDCHHASVVRRIYSRRAVPARLQEEKLDLDALDK